MVVPMPRVPWRRSGAVLGGLLAVAVLSGCSFETFTACPAVGYGSTLHVHVAGDGTDIGEVRVCDPEGACSAPSPRIRPVETAEPPIEPATPSTTTAGPGLPATDPGLGIPQPDGFPDAVEVEAPLAYAQGGGNRWWFDFVLGGPPRVTVTALAFDGSVLAEIASDLVWQRVGGTAECGGPMQAGPIILEVG